ncbi:MAG TPA: YbhB/YbcL family Raf kinase inhibitor-like protein [Stellaceae bacterium]|nr:YbhB/YbcL family Raf kinase inhibitor-like protein [Stellaceae bacterium]
MIPKRSLARAIGAALLLLAGGSLLAQTARFSVDFSWSGTGSCFDPNSPPFTLSGVPAGTKRLVFAMKDLDAPGFAHGGGSVLYSGQSQIARGAFSYKGPCPPQGPHTYQWTVEAQDGGGRTLATATVARKFPER